MEVYAGVKFPIKKIADQFRDDDRLVVLHRWVRIFADLGLAPIHPEGAYGNHSYRDGDDWFVITKTGMIPHERLDKNDYCRVRYSETDERFEIEGKYDPSSECFLHHYIYSNFPGINAVLHGHSDILTRNAVSLGIPETKKEQPYGTVALAEEALEVLGGQTSFFVLKNHGFVAVGDTLEKTASTVLDTYIHLIRSFI